MPVVEFLFLSVSKRSASHQFQLFRRALTRHLTYDMSANRRPALPVYVIFGSSAFSQSGITRNKQSWEFRPTQGVELELELNRKQEPNPIFARNRNRTEPVFLKLFILVHDGFAVRGS